MLLCDAYESAEADIGSIDHRVAQNIYGDILKFYLTVIKDFAPGSAKHKQLSTWLRHSFLAAVIPVVAALAALQLSGWPVALAVLVAGYAIGWLLLRRRG